MVAKNQQVLSKDRLQFSNTLSDCLFFIGQGCIREIHRTHRKGDTHVPHLSEPFTLFEGADEREL